MSQVENVVEDVKLETPDLREVECALTGKLEDARMDLEAACEELRLRHDAWVGFADAMREMAKRFDAKTKSDLAIAEYLRHLARLTNILQQARYNAVTLVGRDGEAD